MFLTFPGLTCPELLRVIVVEDDIVICPPTTPACIHQDYLHILCSGLCLLVAVRTTARFPSDSIKTL